MSAKLAAALLLILSVTVGCVASPADAEDLDELEGPEVVASATAELRPVNDEAPTPPALPVPDFADPHRRWELEPYFDALRRERRLGGCYMHYAKVYDPSRGSEIEIPITVCR